MNALGEAVTTMASPIVTECLRGLLRPSAALLEGEGVAATKTALGRAAGELDIDETPWLEEEDRGRRPRRCERKKEAVDALVMRSLEEAVLLPEAAELDDDIGRCGQRSAKERVQGLRKNTTSSPTNVVLLLFRAQLTRTE